MRWKLLSRLCFLTFFIFGCNLHPFNDTYGRWLIDTQLPPQADAADRAYIDQLRQGEFDQIERDMDPSLKDSNLPATLAKMAALFPPGDPKSVKPVGVDLNNRTTNITYEYEFATGWILANVATDETHKITGFHVQPLSDSLENINKFTLTGKSPLQYSIFGLAVCAIVFSLSVFVLCIRTKGLKRKWLWALCTLVGVEKIAVNWGTGQLTFGIVSVYIPCVIATRPSYGPITLGVCIPLGAILFLYHRNKLETSRPPALELLMPPESGTTPE